MEDAVRELYSGVRTASRWKQRGKLSRAEIGVRNAEDAGKKPLSSALDFFGSARGKAAPARDEAAPANGTEGKPKRTSGALRSSGTQKRKRVRSEVGTPAKLESFEEWGLGGPFEILTGSKKPTEIQAAAAPCIDAGMEVIGVAPTGSGKTLAYAVPLVKRAAERKKQLGAPGALIIVPTRELAEQVHRVLDRFVQLAGLQSQVVVKMVVNKAHISGMSGGGAKRTNILVATPMRLINSTRSKAVDLSKVKDLVLDEADNLFEEGFVEQVDELLAAVGKCRLHLFSATMPPKVEELAKTVQRAPTKVVVGAKRYGGGTAAVDASTVKQRFMFADGQGEVGKVTAFRRLLAEGMMPPVLVFVQSQERATQLFKELVFDGANIDAIHAKRTQAQREAAVENFRSGKVWILIATDLMARGIDFRCVNTVVNYDIPPTAAAYVHRIGRTGRAGRSGLAITFFTEADKPQLRKIANLANASGAEVPGWMLDMKAARRSVLKQLETRPPKRGRIGTTESGGPGTKRRKKKARPRPDGSDGEDEEGG